MIIICLLLTMNSTFLKPNSKSNSTLNFKVDSTFSIKKTKSDSIIKCDLKKTIELINNSKNK
jgi:hypothetical protein